MVLKECQEFFICRERNGRDGKQLRGASSLSGSPWIPGSCIIRCIRLIVWSVQVSSTTRLDTCIPLSEEVTEMMFFHTEYKVDSSGTPMRLGYVLDFGLPIDSSEL